MRLVALSGLVLMLGQHPLNVKHVTVSEPSRVASLDAGQLKGEPARLAWSPEGDQLYVQIADTSTPAKVRHYLFAVEDGSRKEAEAEPAWATRFWNEKSGQSAPGSPALKIGLKTEQRRQRTTSAPMGGDLARGGIGGETGTSSGDAGSAAYSAQSVTVHAMTLLGQTIGEFSDGPIVPGRTFGWGPNGSMAIAFATVKDGRITVMDQTGARTEIASSKDGFLPAWAPDGSRLAWIEKDGRRKFALRVAHVQTP